MFKVIGKNVQFETFSLNEAIMLAMYMDETVTIKGPLFQIVGKFDLYE